MVQERELQPISILKAETKILKAFNNNEEKPKLYADLLEMLDVIIKGQH